MSTEPALFLSEALYVGRVHVVSSPFARMKGLLGRRSLPAGEGMLIVPANAIHTAFMRFAIDVVFFDAELRVVRWKSDLKPFLMAFGGRSAHSVLEMQSGWFEMAQLQAGMQAQLR